MPLVFRQICCLGVWGSGIPMTTPLVSAFQTVPLTNLLGPVIGVANGDLAIRQQIDGQLRFTGGAEHINANLDLSGEYPAVHPRLHQFLKLSHR